MYERQCPKTLQKLIGAAIISLSISKSNFVHVSLPDCQKLQYEEDLAKVGKKCYLTGLFSKWGVHPEPAQTRKYLKRLKSLKCFHVLLTFGSIALKATISPCKYHPSQSCIFSTILAASCSYCVFVYSI